MIKKVAFSFGIVSQNTVQKLDVKQQKVITFCKEKLYFTSKTFERNFAAEITIRLVL